MPQLGRSSGTMAVANELKLTKPDNQPEGVVVTLGNDSDKKTLTDAAGTNTTMLQAATPTAYLMCRSHSPRRQDIKSYLLLRQHKWEEQTTVFV